jgi:hypothetical protein
MVVGFGHEYSTLSTDFALNVTPLLNRMLLTSGVIGW